MSQFTVTSSELTKKANELQNLNGRFHSAIAQLCTSESSLNSMWDGEANDTFHAAFMQDKEKMNQFYELIVNYISALNSIAVRYQQTEQTNTDIAKNRTYH